MDDFTSIIKSNIFFQKMKREYIKKIKKGKKNEKEKFF